MIHASTSHDAGRRIRQPMTWADNFLYLGVACLSVAVLGSWSSSGDTVQSLRSLHLAVCFVTSISLGGLFYVILQHLTNARASVVVRRIAELTTVAFPVLFILTLPNLIALLMGSGAVFVWNDAAVVAEDQLIQAKTPYLNAPFFVSRTVLYFVAWTLMARFFLARSIASDGFAASKASRRWSAPSMILFAVTINFAAFDWIMTLDPHWFSACLGIYYFAGCVVATLAAMTLIVFTLQRFNYLQDITLEHYHDLGKLLFGFTMFWAYIAFSQYLLIWYANIPEETLWYAHRQTGGWQYVGLLLIVGHFLIPLFGMMSRHVKRNPSALAAWAAFLLLMRLVDVFWLVKPVYASTISVTAADVLCLIGVAAIATRSVLKRMAAVDLVPTADPHLEESVAFHQAF